LIKFLWQGHNGFKRYAVVVEFTVRLLRPIFNDMGKAVTNTIINGVIKATPKNMTSILNTNRPTL